MTVGIVKLLLPCLFNLCRIRPSYLTVLGEGALQLLELVKLYLCEPDVHPVQDASDLCFFVVPLAPLEALLDPLVPLALLVRL